jgi:hypothetical protein
VRRKNKEDVSTAPDHGTTTAEEGNGVRDASKGEEKTGQKPRPKVKNVRFFGPEWQSV